MSVHHEKKVTLTRDQMRRLRVVSDTVLYKRAKEFFENNPDAPQPLSNAQINGLLNIAQTNQYKLISAFVKQQHERDSQEKDVKTFYTALEGKLKELPSLAEDDGLLSEDTAGEATKEERSLVHLLLAQEFLQHLAAENMLRKG